MKQTPQGKGPSPWVRVPSQGWDPEMSLAIEEAIEEAKSRGKFIPRNIWDILRKRAENGDFEGTIDTIIPKNLFSSKSKVHYFVIKDIRKREVECTSCELHHGGILEAHLLTRYKIENGIIYFDGNPINETP